MPTLSERKKMIGEFSSEIPALILTTHKEEDLLLLLPAKKATIAYTNWSSRTNKLVYFLCDGVHTELDLARLLHKSLASIRRSLGLLFCARFIEIAIKKKDTTMTALNVSLLRSTLEYIAPPNRDNQIFESYYVSRRNMFATIFLGRLRAQSRAADDFFYTHTDVDMKNQGRILVENLWDLVESLESDDADLIRKIQALGDRQKSCGVEPWMYPMIGRTLIETFSEFLDVTWTQAMEDQWTAAYALVSGVILSAYAHP